MLLVLFYNWLFAAAMMFVGWLFYCRYRNPGIVDLFWGLIICFNCCLAIFLGKYFTGLAQIIYMLCVLLWGVRLGLFLLITRVSKGCVEHRYVEISKSWKGGGPKSFFWHYQVQAILSLFVSVSAYPLVMYSAGALTTSFLIALAVAILAIICEWIADAQLHKFKIEKQYGVHSNVVCRRGFWAYMRHPNYTFEMLFWVACAVMASIGGWVNVSWIAPVFMYLLMRFVTGRITERESLKRRGEEYAKYQSEVGMFLPKLFNTKKEEK